MNKNLTYLMPGARRLISFSEPLIMGIVNLTNDSFYDKSRVSQGEIVDVCGQMVADGADILDFGAMSSRPGAKEMAIEEEVERLIPCLELVRKTFPDIIISVDTYRSEVVNACKSFGIDIINDITAGTRDDALLKTVAEAGLAYIMMHMKGMPSTMQDDTAYKNLIIDILSFFSERLYHARAAGVKDIIIDPGIGFGKSIQDNFHILHQLSSFGMYDLPVLMGVSRKSFIYRTLGVDAGQALNGTTAMHMIALLNGASLLRVHDVKEAVECKKLFLAYQRDQY